jgi:hypothetical protein
MFDEGRNIQDGGQIFGTEKNISSDTPMDIA